jgi:hypothetical protein
VRVPYFSGLSCSWDLLSSVLSWCQGVADRVSDWRTSYDSPVMAKRFSALSVLSRCQSQVDGTLYVRESYSADSVVPGAFTTKGKTMVDRLPYVAKACSVELESSALYSRE